MALLPFGNLMMIGCNEPSMCFPNDFDFLSSYPSVSRARAIAGLALAVCRRESRRENQPTAL